MYPPAVLPSSQPSPASRSLSPQTPVHAAPHVASKPCPESTLSEVRRSAIDTTPSGVRKAWSVVPVMLVPICSGCAQDTSLHENTC